MKLQIKKGSTSQSVYIFIQDSASTTGGGKTGLAYNTASLVAYYVRPLGSATAITLATQTVTGAWSSGGFVEVDSTNMPGAYRLDLPDAVIASGVNSVVVMLKGASGMAPVVMEIMLVAYDPQDSVRYGLTALPNATAGANGGLPLSVDSSGRVDVLKINGTSQTARDIGASVLLSSGTGSGQISLSSGTVTVGTNNDKTGYSLAQSFPTNFSSLAITAGGAVTVGTNSDKTGYALTSAYDPAKTASQAGDAMALTSSERTTLTAAIWAALTSGLTTIGSIGKLLVDNVNATITSRLASGSYTAPDNASISTIASTVASNLDVAVSTRSTYAGGDTSGTTTLLSRITATRAGYLDNLTNLDAAITTRLASAGYIAPDNSSITAIKAKTDNLPAAPAAVGDIPTANQNADALLDRAAGVETNRTLRQALRIVLASVAGKLSGAATSTITVRDTNDSKNRLVVAVDADGNRTAVTYDAS